MIVIPIRSADAERKYGITTPHEQYENNEIRFRLRSSDGSSYVRTVALNSNWQRAHKHSGVYETYLVQRKWMALAFFKKGKPIIRRYAKGSMITVDAQIFHNVYLPKDGVIHTIKSNFTSKPDIKTDSEMRTKLSKDISENELLRKPLIIINRAKNVSRKVIGHLPQGWPPYLSKEYRHFDTIIWQLPAWSTAILVAILSGFAFIYTRDAEKIIDALNFTVPDLGRLLLIVSMAFFLSCYFLLYRWRVHQRYTSHKNTPSPALHLFGAQMMLQAIISSEFSIVLTLFIYTSSKHVAKITYPILVFALTTAIMVAFCEYLICVRHDRYVEWLRIINQD